MQLFKRVFRALTFGLLAIVLLFEEWGWEPLSRGMARLAKVPLWAAIERKITQLPKVAALLVFFVPAIALLPVKLLALALFGRGHAVWGLVLLLSAKLLGTAILARLFQLTQPALMQFAWFAKWYPRWKNWKDGLMDKVRQSEPWQAAIRFKRSAKTWWMGIKN
jgi:hypothetical protein